MVGPDTIRSSEHHEVGRGRLAYLCYGDSERHWLELRASLLSALRHMPGDCGVAVVVATDHPERVHALGLDVEVAHLDEATLARWRGRRDYNHRIKNAVVPWLLDRYEAPVCLVDTDTFFVASPVKLFDRVGPGRTLMHAPEPPDAGDRIARALGGAQFDSPLGGAWRFAEGRVTAWNSGVIGVDPAERAILDEVLWLSDEVYGRVKIFNVEQFAFAQVFMRRSTVSKADDVVVHYWGAYRPFFHVRARRAFARVEGGSVEEQVAATADLHAAPPGHPTLRRLSLRLWRWWRGHDARVLSAALAAVAGDPRRPGDPDLQRIWRDLARMWMEEADAVELARSSRWFAGVRDAASLELLDQGERERWQQLWERA